MEICGCSHPKETIARCSITYLFLFIEVQIDLPVTLKENRRFRAAGSTFEVRGGDRLSRPAR